MFVLFGLLGYLRRYGELQVMRCRRYIFFLLLLPGCMACQVRADNAGRLDVVPLSDGSYRVEFRLDEVSAADLTKAHVQDARRIDREWEGRPPAFVRVLELDSGRFVRIEQLSTRSRATFHRGVPAVCLSDHAPMGATLARMGRRVFVRLEVRPLQPDPETGGWRVHDRMTAVVRVSESAPVSAKDVPERLSVLLLSEGESCSVCPPPASLGVSEGSGGTPAEFKPHRSVTNDIAWKIRISEPGLYRITGAGLEAAGMPEAYRDTTQLRLASRDQTIPMWRSTEGAMSADDYLLFYGAAMRAPATTQNVYWLSIDAPSPAFDAVSVAPTNGWPLVTSAWHRVDYAPKNFYRAQYNPLVDGYDHWFAMEVYGGTTSNIAFATPHPVQTGDVYLAYSVHGLNTTTNADPDHRSVFRVGGVHAGTYEYDGQVNITGTSSVPATAVSPGTTTVSVEQQIPSGVPNPAFSSAYIEWLTLCYQRQLMASNLPFYIRAPDEPSRLRVQKIPSNTVWLLDVSDPFQPLRLMESDITGSPEDWTLEFEYAPPAAACLAIFDVSNPLDPLSIELVRFRNLSDASRQADYLVVTPELFREPVYRLLKHRYKNDLSVQVATIEDVYNEFSYGLVDPVAVRQYFGYAYHHYQKDEPRYALLVGSGTYDPLNNLGASATNHIPARLGPAPWRRTAHEQWFATIDGDDLLPDIALGRIPAYTVDEVSNAVRKIVAFETAATNAAWRETALLVADKVDGAHNFKAFTTNNTVIHLESGGFDPLFGIVTAFRDDLPEAAQVRNIIQVELNRGVHYINYMGHGGLRQWSSPHFWHNDDALAATNTVYPFVTVFTCQNGLFFDPTDTSLVAAMLLGGGGASGMLAPSALSVQIFSEQLADGFFEALAVDRVERAGDAMLEGFLRLWTHNANVAELRFYAIFGDPAQHLWGGAQP